MERQPFITPAMSILLDAVRASAALLVLGGHAVQLGLYSGPYPFNPHMQHNAVVIFFVLSGLVIAHSVGQREYSLADYVIARAARILPVALFALAFGTLVFFVLHAAGLMRGVQLPTMSELLVGSLLMPALFLNESWGTGGQLLNVPYWSLAYEVWFYAIFAAGYFLSGSRRLVWIGVLAIVAGWRIILLMPIWLMGAALARYGSRWQPRGAGAFLLGCLALAAMIASDALSEQARYASFLIHSPFGYDENFSEYFLSDYLMGLAIAAMFVALRPLAERSGVGLERMRRPIKWLAGFSFSLYLLHWPILSALAMLGVSVGTNPFAFGAMIAGILAFCALSAQLTEYRSRDIRSWLTRRTIMGRPRAVAA